MSVNISVENYNSQCKNHVSYTANIYLFKVNNRDSRKWCETCLNLTIKTPERRYRRCSDIFTVNC